jgi:osmotically-inducible protein OsmY
VANYQNGGRNVAVPDESRPSWRPQDQDPSHRARGNEDDHDYRGWRERHWDERQERDPRRWEGSRGSELSYGDDREYGRSTERYGQGQSGYSAGRYGDDRSQQMHNRNEMVSPGSFEDRPQDRHYDLGTDDRFTGRGWSAWSDRHERSHGGYEPERYSTQGGYGRQSDQRGYDQRGDQRAYGRSFDRGQAGYGQDRGFSQNGYGGQGYDPRSAQHMGYQSSAIRGETDWSPSQRVQDGRGEQHVHRGTGPHRGKGPLGYQRSDERIREMVCEALADDDMIDASQIHVTVKDGEVTLSGVVDSRRIKREAEDCVASVSGVRDVQLQLRVRDEQDRSMRTGTSQAGTQAASTTTGTSQLGNGLANGKIENDATNQDKKHRA